MVSSKKNVMYVTLKVAKLSTVALTIMLGLLPLLLLFKFDRGYLAHNCPNSLFANFLYTISDKSIDEDAFDQKTYQLIKQSALQSYRLNYLASELAQTYEDEGQDHKAEAIYLALNDKEKLLDESGDCEKALIRFYQRHNRVNDEYEVLLKRLQIARNSDHTNPYYLSALDNEMERIAELEISRDNPREAKMWLLLETEPQPRLLAWCNAALNDKNAARKYYQQAVEQASKRNCCGAIANRNDISMGGQVDMIEFEFLQRQEYANFLRWQGDNVELKKQTAFLDQAICSLTENEVRKFSGIGNLESIPYKPHLYSRKYCNLQNYERHSKSHERTDSNFLTGLKYLYDETIGSEIKLKMQLQLARTEFEKSEALDKLWKHHALHGQSLFEIEKQIRS